MSADAKARIKALVHRLLFCMIDEIKSWPSIYKDAAAYPCRHSDDDQAVWLNMGPLTGYCWWDATDEEAVGSLELEADLAAVVQYDTVIISGPVGETEPMTIQFFYGDALRHQGQVCPKTRTVAWEVIQTAPRLQLVQ